MSAQRYIDVQHHGDACCVRMRQGRLDESEIAAMAEEFLELVEDGGCRKLALALGPRPPEFLYSVFLARLVQVRRALTERGGEMVLCYAGPDVLNIFACCSLDNLFRFYPDFESALAAWTHGAATA
jgi:anti-anti-sigma factor